MRQVRLSNGAIVPLGLRRPKSPRVFSPPMPKIKAVTLLACRIRQPLDSKIDAQAAEKQTQLSPDQDAGCTTYDV